jgi:glycosyltransferase involved in cell wall biosynthesis
MRIDMIGARSLPARHGGLETAAEQLSRELHTRGHDVRVLVNESILDATWDIPTRQVASVHTKHLHTLSQTAFSLPALLRRAPDIAHFHGVGPGMLAAASKLRGIPSVVTVQGLDWQRDKWGNAAASMFGRVVRRTLPRADGVISVSQAVQRRLHEDLGINSRYIPNGVRIPSLNGSDDFIKSLGLRPQGYILFAARLVPEKGLEILLDAHTDSSTDLPLVVAGSGVTSYAGGYEEQLRALASPRTKFVGHRSGDELAELFRHARVFVLPSYMEGLPLGLLEAMSFGLPVVHSDIPECVEITRGDAGWSFEVRNSASLAQVLNLVLDSDVESQSRARLARQRVAAEYSWPAIATATEQYYEEIRRDSQGRRVRD